MKFGTKLVAASGLAVLMALPAVEISPAFAQVETIVVTARKREENIQDVPVSVSAYSGDALLRQNINNVNDLSQYVPGFQFLNSSQRDFERPVIRGQANILGESGVSFFINGVFFDGSLSAIDLSEVERIEIVRGPQSALYGRNTYAGAINVITKKPGDEFQGSVKLEAAMHSQYEATFGVSGPLVQDVLSGGIYARYYEYGGEHVNQYDGREMGDEQSYSIAGRFALTPADDIEVLGRFVYAEDDDGASPNFLQPTSFNNVFNGGYFAGEVGPRSVNMNDVDQLGVSDEGDIGFEQERIDASLTVDWDLTDAVKVVSTTGYQDIERDFKLDVDYLPTSFQNTVGAIFPIGLRVVPGVGLLTGLGVLQFHLTLDRLTEIEQFSQELRFEYDDGGPLRAMLGGYYYDKEEVQNNRIDPTAFTDTQQALAAAQLAAKDVTDPALNTFACTPPRCIEIFRVGIIGDNQDVNTEDIRNWSIFGRLEYDITSSLTGTFEGRYQEERVQGTQFDFSADSTTMTEGTFTAFLPRMSLIWDVTDMVGGDGSSNVYFTASRGTKPGGLNVSATARLAGQAEFEEEKLWSYEIGTKNTFADGQILLNLAGFFNTLEGYQLTQNIEAVDPETGERDLDSATVNAGDAHIFGVEVESVISPRAIEGLTLTANYSFIDSEFQNGADDNVGLLNDIGDDGIVNGSAGGFQGNGTSPVAGSIAGNTIPRSSKHQFFAGFDYSRPLQEVMGQDMEWFTGMNVAYNSSRFSQVVNLAEFGEAVLLNANLGIRTENWAVTIWGKNLLDEDSPQEVVRYRDFDVRNPNPGGSSLSRAFFGQLRRGRQVGASVTASF